MIEFEEANRIAQNVLEDLEKKSTSSCKELALMEDRTRKTEYGWVFFWHSKRWVVDRDPKYRFLGGNAPFVVTKVDGKVHFTGTGRRIEHYLEKFKDYNKDYSFDSVHLIPQLELAWLEVIEGLNTTYRKPGIGKNFSLDVFVNTRTGNISFVGTIDSICFNRESHIRSIKIAFYAAGTPGSEMFAVKYKQIVSVIGRAMETSFNSANKTSALSKKINDVVVHVDDVEDLNIR